MKILLETTVRPSVLLKQAVRLSRQESESDKARVLGRVQVLGKIVTCYENGGRTCEGMTDGECYRSELLRYVHASLLTRGPVGDRRLLWVDAMKHPVRIIAYNREIDTFIRWARHVVKTRQMSPELLLDEPINKERLMSCPACPTTSKTN